MAERSSITQKVQVGVETVAGTKVAATKEFQSIGIEPSIRAEVDRFRPMGTKFQTLTALGKEWVEANLTGKATYTELVYLLSSVVDAATITTPGGGTSSRNWEFIAAHNTEDAPKTLTVESGSSVRAHRFGHGIVNELRMAFSRQTVEVSGSMLGQQLEDGITLSPASGVSAVELVPVLPTEVSVYLDTTYGGLGGTKLTRVLTADWQLGSRYGPLWVLDAANDSWVTTVETEPDLQCSILVEADATGMGILSDLRDGDTAFLRIEAVGEIIEGAIPYTLTIDTAVKVADVGNFQDQDGVFAIEWTLLGVYDASWGKAFEINVINKLTAL